jgi:hypothetical protein
VAEDEQLHVWQSISNRFHERIIQLSWRLLTSRSLLELYRIERTHTRQNTTHTYSYTVSLLTDRLYSWPSILRILHFISPLLSSLPFDAVVDALNTEHVLLHIGHSWQYQMQMISAGPHDLWYKEHYLQRNVMSNSACSSSSSSSRCSRSRRSEKFSTAFEQQFEVEVIGSMFESVGSTK